ncbi:hypothetical protein GCM10023319_65410 [Nocardia iowensis]
MHSLPAFAGCSLSPLTLAITGDPSAPGRVCTVMPQPTPQYEHAVLAVPLAPSVPASNMPPIMAIADCAGFTARYRQVTIRLTARKTAGEV